MLVQLNSCSLVGCLQKNSLGTERFRKEFKTCERLEFLPAVGIEGRCGNRSRKWVNFPQVGNGIRGELKMGKVFVIVVLIDAIFILGIIGLLRLKKDKKIKEGIASVLALMGLFVVMIFSLLAMILAALLVMG